MLLPSFAAVLVAAVPRLDFTQVRSGATPMCVGGGPHVLAFDTVGAVDEAFVPLDPSMVKAIQCDIDNTQIQLQMKDATALAKFKDLIDYTMTTYGQAFLTGSAANGTLTCVNGTEQASPPAPSPQSLMDMQNLSDTAKTSVCAQFSTCEGCLSIPYCE